MPAWPSIPPNATSAYSNITANDNSRVHNGHNFHFHQYYTVQQSGHDFGGSSATLKRKRSLADIQVNPGTRAAQESLDTVLKKLGKLSLSVRHRKEGDAAEKIARRIAAVFEAITAHGEDETWDKTAARHLGKLGATVEWEEKFDINSTPQRKPISKYAKAKTRRVFVQIGRWDISLTTITRDSPLEGSLCYVETFSTLRVEPRRQSSGSALAVSFSECWDGRATSTIPPTVLAYKMVNDDAEVFQRIKDDDLDGLIRLLACGEASIHDCDGSGRSLLHYACRWDSVTCCSFLVDRGVDIDRFERAFPDPFRRRAGLVFVSPLQVMPINTWGSDVGSCFQILWQAGADPTITANVSKALPPLLEALQFRLNHNITALLVRACFKEGNPYVDFQERLKYRQGRGYWLELCWGDAILEDPYPLRTFADKGVNIAETDNYGFNCLFVFMARANNLDYAGELMALLCLLAIFDDIYALDATGNDIFAYINELRAWPAAYATP